MNDFIHNKTSGFFVTTLIGVIVLSFMFTGYQSFQNGGGGGSSIAKVGDYSVTPEEYQQEYNRQIEFFKQMFGGDMSQKQIENLHIKESVLKNLVQKKLLLKLATDLGTTPSEAAVKEEIKNLPYFKTDGQFDVNRYKGLLAANHLSPETFEADIISQMKMKSIHDLSPNFPVSEGYMQDIEKFKEDKIDAEVISISKNALQKHIEISKTEIEKYLSAETNKNRILSMFKERKAEFDRPEEITARHILIKGDDKSKIEKIAKEVTPANFAKKADQYTEDESGKGKGGALGSFKKGTMVPEFDQVAFTQKPGTISAPVKTTFGYHLIFVEKKNEAFVASFETVKEKLTIETLQKEKIEEIKKITVNLTNGLKKALETNNDKEVKSLLDQYSLTSKKITINQIDGASNGANLSTQTIKDLFGSARTPNRVLLSDDGGTITMIKTLSSTTIAPPKITADNNLKSVLGRKMIDEMLKKLEKEVSVKIYSSQFQE